MNYRNKVSCILKEGQLLWNIGRSYWSFYRITQWTFLRLQERSFSRCPFRFHLRERLPFSLSLFFLLYPPCINLICRAKEKKLHYLVDTARSFHACKHAGCCIKKFVITSNNGALVRVLPSPPRARVDFFLLLEHRSSPFRFSSYLRWLDSLGFLFPCCKYRTFDRDRKKERIELREWEGIERRKRDSKRRWIVFTPFVEPSLRNAKGSAIYVHALLASRLTEGSPLSRASWPGGETRWCGRRGGTLCALPLPLSVPLSLHPPRYTHPLPRATNFSARISLSFFVQACSASSYIHTLARRPYTQGSSRYTSMHVNTYSWEGSVKTF